MVGLNVCLSSKSGRKKWFTPSFSPSATHCMYITECKGRRRWFASAFHFVLCFACCLVTDWLQMMVIFETQQSMQHSLKQHHHQVLWMCGGDYYYVLFLLPAPHDESLKKKQCVSQSNSIWLQKRTISHVSPGAGISTFASSLPFSFFFRWKRSWKRSAGRNQQDIQKLEKWSTQSRATQIEMQRVYLKSGAEKRSWRNDTSFCNHFLLKEKERENENPCKITLQ